MSFILFQNILVLFLMIGMGFTITKLGVIKVEQSRAISAVCIYLIMPCVVIKAFQIEYTPQIRDGLLLAFATAFLMHGLLFLIIGLLKKPLKLNALERASIIYSNAGNLVIPLVSSMLGDEWVIYASAFMCVQNLFSWTHGTTIMQGKTSLNWKKIITNMNLISSLIGLFLFLLHIRLPHLVQDAIGRVGACVGPLSMIMLGIVMAGVQWKKILSNNRIYLIVVLRMLIVPFIMVLFLKYSGLAGLVENGQTILLISLLAGITPTASTINQMSILYHQQPEYSAAINTITTLVCIFSMPVMIALYMM